MKEHREWFRSRADGTVQYAENPPKKYQDIYPFDFETANYAALCGRIKERGVYLDFAGHSHFSRGQSAHEAVCVLGMADPRDKREYPDVIFLSEAFTRPKVMYQLAKLGFTQSYTYFAWKNTKAELTEYFTEITQPPVSEFFRPNLWPNTPDILNEYLQKGGRPAFMARLVLAGNAGRELWNLWAGV